MENFNQLRFLFLIIVSFFYQSIKAQDASSIYQNAVRSTVTIETDRSIGSGFFIGNHLIITCYHVVEGSSEIYFYTNSSEKKYRIKGYLKVDRVSDLILLFTDEYTGVPLKFSMIKPQPGQKVFTIGSPEGMNFSISDGIVSGIRNMKGIDLIQITAPISHGNSGGPVLDQFGALLGVSVGNIPNAQNLNFCIPKQYIETILSSAAYNPKPLSTLTGSVHLQQRNESQDIASDFNYEEEALLKALIEYAFPLVIDNAGTSIQINTRGKNPEYGEHCFFFAADLSYPRMLAYGTITGIAGNSCTVDIVESISEFNNHKQYLILFAHELK